MIRIEFAKQARRVRTYVGWGICVLIPIIITLALKFGGPPHDRGGREAGFFIVARHSGLNVPFAALTAMSGFLLPIVVSLFFGESVSGEANWGTLRYLLVRPVARARLLVAKATVAGVLSIIATMLVAIAALAAGTAAFGWHPMISPALQVIPTGTAIARLGIATIYVAWNMAGLAAFALMLSVMTDAPVGATAGGVGLIIVSGILDAVSALGSIRYGLPTHYWDAWMGMFKTPVDSAEMVRGVLLQLPYVIVFGAIAFWWLRRKDVLS